MSTPIIQCQNLSHFYSGFAALSNVTFSIDTVEPVGLVGPNGAGKTTLLSILCGFLRPTSGTVSILGHQPGKGPLGKVAALPQDARLDPAFTLAKQLGFYAQLQGFGPKAAKSEALRVLEAVDLKSSLQEKPGNLSHGMAKRVAIAQAIIGSPEIVFLDEPTAGLDPVNTRNIRSIVAELSPAITFVISSHDLVELGRLCQHILLLDKGKMEQLQLDESESENTTRYFTIQMTAAPIMEVMAKLQLIKGVLVVTNPQKNELIVEYNSQETSSMDIKILQCFADNGWQYRQFSRGKSLEEKLFFEEKTA